MKNSGIAVTTLVTALLGACATTPSEPVREKLDPDTATTVTVLTSPVELFSESSVGPAKDPFAYIAPFETDKMGERALFLWVSAPQNAGPLSEPQVLCNGQPLALQPVSSNDVKIDLAQLNLSQPPYAAPVPWSIQWYFRLPPEDLKCLAGATGIALETHEASGQAERFSTDRKNIASLDAFTRRY